MRLETPGRAKPESSKGLGKGDQQRDGNDGLERPHLSLRTCTKAGLDGRYAVGCDEGCHAYVAEYGSLQVLRQMEISEGAWSRKPYACRNGPAGF